MKNCPHCGKSLSKAGEAPSTFAHKVLSLVPTAGSISAKEMRRQLPELDKGQFFSAIAYLTRNDKIVAVGWGRYCRTL